MKVLVVVDMQNDFITGPLGTPEARAIVPRVKEKVKEAVRNEDLIIYTRDTHFEDYLKTMEGRKLPIEHCVYKSDGWRIPTELLPPADYENMRFVDKYTFGSYELVNLLQHSGLARSCNEIELIGLVADICVISNALLVKAAFYNVMTVSVDSSCIAGTTNENYQSALNVMRSCQIEVT